LLGDASHPVFWPRTLDGSTMLRLAFVAVLVLGCEEAAPPEATTAAPGVDARTPGGGFVPAKDVSVFDPAADAGVVELPAPPSAPEHCALRPSDPGPALIRRLNRREYDNTIRDLVGADLAPAESFLPDEEFLGFDNQAASLQISPLRAEQYMTAAELVADHVAAHRLELLDCDPAVTGEVACVRAFIEGFGLRAWRRPLETDEIDALAGLYEVAAALDPPQFDATLKLVVQALLESPNFLFRIEVGEPFESLRIGEPAGLDPTRIRLSDWEIASRLSYLLWQTMPDAVLFEAAARGELATRASVQAQARRMLAHERARPAMLAFFDQWLRYAETLKIDRDPQYYPDFRPEHRDLLVTESRTFISNLVFGADRDLRALFSASYTFMDETLARFYGVPGVEGPGFRRVELDPAQRAGILTQGAVMAATAKPNMTSPVLRGQYVRERVLCTPLPPPPPNIPIVPPSPDPNSSTREKFEEHGRNPACAGCHQLMDPIGFGFENFDAVGRWRTEENGHPIDSSCQLAATQDADGAFANGTELARRLAESEQVQRCVVTQFFRFAQGRGETLADLCTLDGLFDDYVSSGFDFLVMVEQLVASDAFRFRRRPPAQADDADTATDAGEAAR